MNNFSVYFSLGFEHILHPLAYDHILFVVSLCLLFLPSTLKPLFWLVTAFTIGHSITLFLVALKVFNAPLNIIEFLIPITIAVSAGYNIFILYKKKQPILGLQYTITAIFGMVHGIAFATQTFGLEGVKGIMLKVIGFNFGIEIAQLCIVAFMWFLTYIFVTKFKVPKPILAQVGSVLILGFALFLAVENFKNL